MSRSCLLNQNLLLAALLMTASAVLWAEAVVGESLRGVLGELEPEETVAVIIYFAKRADLADLQAMSPGQRRAALPVLLKRHATDTQSSLKAHLHSHGITRFKTLWINNSLAVTVPASMVASLATRPEVERIDLDVTVDLPSPVNGRR